MAMLDLRTIAPYHYQSLFAFGASVLVFGGKPVWLLPGLVLIFSAQIAPFPFRVADKAGLETLYGVLPVRRRSVVYGHYPWAESVPFGGRTLLTMLALSWATYSVNIAIQFPVLIRFGYTSGSVLGTTLPLAVIIGTLYKTHLTVASMQDWIALVAVVGLVVFAASAALAVTADRRRMRHRANWRTA
jgi:hypothetical protein